MDRGGLRRYVEAPSDLAVAQTLGYESGHLAFARSEITVARRRSRGLEPPHQRTGFVAAPSGPPVEERRRPVGALRARRNGLPRKAATGPSR